MEVKEGLEWKGVGGRGDGEVTTSMEYIQSARQSKLSRARLGRLGDCQALGWNAPDYNADRGVKPMTRKLMTAKAGKEPGTVDKTRLPTWQTRAREKRSCICRGILAQSDGDPLEARGDWPMRWPVLGGVAEGVVASIVDRTLMKDERHRGNVRNMSWIRERRWIGKCNNETASCRCRGDDGYRHLCMFHGLVSMGIARLALCALEVRSRRMFRASSLSMWQTRFSLNLVANRLSCEISRVRVGVVACSIHIPSSSIKAHQ